MEKLTKPDYTAFGALSSLIGSFDVHKTYAALVATAMQEISSMEPKARHLWECGTYIELDGDGRLVKSNLCRERWCPLCQWRRSLRVFGQVQQMLAWLSPQNFKYLHLVLTVPNCAADDLKTRCDWLYRRSTAMFYDRFKAMLTLRGLHDGDGLPSFYSALQNAAAGIAQDQDEREYLSHHE